GWVMDGGQVRVGAGTYVESVSLTRPLTVTLLAAVNLDGSLDLQDGRWELEPSASFSLTGDLGLNGGEYDFAGRPLILNGTAAQTLSGALNLSDLQVNNSGAEAVRAANPLVVESLELVDGTFIPACSST